MNKDEEPVIIKQTYHSSIEIVWKAITEVGQMKKWFFENIPSFKPEVGFETQFSIVSQGRNFLHMWRVIEVTPIQKITYNWKYDGYRGDANVTFELSAKENETTLILSFVIFESFPDDIPEFTRDSCICG